MANFNNFHYAQSLADMLYGVSMQEEDFEEIGLIAWQQIGNKRTRLYRYCGEITPCNLSLELPCNADMLEAVTTDFEDYAHTTNYSDHGDFNSAVIEAYNEAHKTFKDPLYIHGKFVKFERVGNTLYFTEPYGHINVLYKGVILDEDGLPEITDSEANAIAAYCAYVNKYKEGIQLNNAQIIQVAKDLQNQWRLLCDQARVDRYLTQNEWDEILDAKTNWDRKQFGKSYKLYR